MSEKKINILIAGGGTGGHLYPALAIADEIRKRRADANILFVGTRDKIEARVVPERGYAFTTIWVSGFHRGMRMQNFLLPLKVVVSLFQSFFLIARYRPNVVLGTGGYVCAPVILAASLLRIPTVIHESNSYPGVTTRLLAGRATTVFTAFAATNLWLKRTATVELVGTPTRASLDGVTTESALGFFGLDAAKKTVFVFGGSLGAASINSALLNIAETLKNQNVQLIWQTGLTDEARIKSAIGERNIGWIGSYIDRMELAYAAADIVVCRSGATTIAELTRIGKPAILVPFPHAAADHQTLNAKTLADVGAAVLVPDNELEQKLESAILELLGDRARRASMSAASKSLGKPDAGSVIAAKILDMMTA
ncbi:MAG TPA: undecaprenyldiphospho-muramoylpentapeptide beta-N-acetylglucosaminyltransferase [Bacteroidota bacterium]